MNYEIVLVGNPNTGKTTLFNTLTNSNERASNWHGVTVCEKSKKVKYKNNIFSVYDLPGIYDLDGNSIEEKNAARFLVKNKSKIIVNICDANNFEYNFNLTEKLINNGYKVIIAVNMSNEIKNFDYEKISRQINIPIIEIDARKSKAKQYIFDFIINYANKIKMQKYIIINKKCVNIKEIIKTNKNTCYCKPYKFSDKIDKVILNKVFFPFIFLASLFLIFFFTFGPFGIYCSTLFGKLTSYFFELIKGFIGYLNINISIKKFIEEGIFASLLIVIQFLPQILILTISFNFLEDIGFMSRVAFMLDGVMLKFGLTGKSIFSIMLGCGCTTTAVLTTNNLSNYSLRKRTVFLLPFASCSAKLPIYLIIFSLFFDEYKYIFVFILYLFAFLLLFIFGLILNKLSPNHNNLFIMELPKYRFPYYKKILIDSFAVCKLFILKVGTSIVFCGAIIWFLKNFSLSFTFLNSTNFENSLLFNLSKLFLPLFSIIGLNNVGIISSLFFGLIAKELIVVNLASLNGVSSSFVALSKSLLSSNSLCQLNKTSSIIFVLFVLLYSPCLSALATIRSEFGFKFSFKIFIVQTLIAFLICHIVYVLMININFLKFLLVLFLIVIFLKIMLKLKRSKRLCGENCFGCKGIYCK